MKNITYTQNKASYQDIEAHFKSCDPEFIKELFSRVDLVQYTEKLLAKSVRHEAWSGESLVGLLAVYHGSEFDFITNVSVSQSHAKLGIASALVQRALDTASNDQLKLEVAKSNKTALRLYEKFGFVQEREDERSFYLSFDRNS